MYVQQYRMTVPTLGKEKTWYEKLWSGATSIGGTALDIYGQSKQTQAYKDITGKLIEMKTGNVDYTKLAIIAGGAILAIMLLTKKSRGSNAFDYSVAHGYFRACR